MREELKPPKVRDIAFAIVKECDEKNNEVWNAYMLNLKNEHIEMVIIASKGYGSRKGEKVKTSVLRHLWKDISAKSFVRVEPIMENLLGLSNEFWVSFFSGGVLYDKKYVFLPGTICEENTVTVPLINKKVVMIK